MSGGDGRAELCGVGDAQYSEALDERRVGGKEVVGSIEPPQLEAAQKEEPESQWHIETELRDVATHVLLLVSEHWCAAHLDTWHVRDDRATGGFAVTTVTSQPRFLNSSAQACSFLEVAETSGE